MSRPMLRFLIFGALLFAISRAVAPQGAANEPVVVAAGEIDALRLRFAAQRGRPPDPPEMQALVAERVDEEVLLREALARRLGVGDAVVARRLRESVAALEGVDSPGASEISRVATAEQLGLDSRDLVVRRRLVNLLRLRIAEAARAVEPSTDDLAQAYATKSEALRSPPRVAFAQAYLGPDGEAARTLGAALLARSERRDPRQDARPFPLPDAMPPLARDHMARSFGDSFAREVLALPVGHWSGPVASIHGLHLVRVESVLPGELPPLDAVRGRLREEWLEEREARGLVDALEKLRGQQPVVVEHTPEGDRGAS